MDIAKHMMDKKQLTFEGTEVSYSMLQENLLDLVAQKTPSVLAAAVLILSIMGSGQKVFGANDSGSDALNKIKKNAKEIVEIVKHQGEQVGKNVIKDIEKAKKDAEKEAKEAKGKAEKKGKEVVGKVKEKGKEALDKAADFGKEAGETIEKKADEIKQGFQDFLQKKKGEKEETKPENPAPKKGPQKTEPFNPRSVA